MRLLRSLLIAVLFGAFGAFVAGFGLYIHLQLDKPDLDPWHYAKLSAEFDAERDADLDLDGYLALEQRLDLQVRHMLQGTDSAALKQNWNRFHRLDPANTTESAVDPRWNRTFVLEQADPVGGAVLMHGWSDSPYSVRSLGEALHANGFYVVGLRMPGHGTAPSGQVHATIDDCAAVLRIGARHVRAAVPAERPLVLVGYSTGAGLAVEYALRRMDGEELPAADRLILLSPALGVTAVAKLASLQDALGRLPGLQKLAWTDVLPEYDPYKYNSFAVNGATQVNVLAERIDALMTKLQGGNGRVAGFPPTLAFLSAVDATVSVPAVVDGFLPRLAPNDHELVLFDVDRSAKTTYFMSNPGTELAERMLGEELTHALTVVTNVHMDTEAVLARRRSFRTKETVDEPLGLAWPRGVFSLAHVSLPFSPDDPNYGEAPNGDPNAPSLGRIEARGERGVLVVNASMLMRLRYNPFFSYLEQRALDFALTGTVASDR